MFQQDSEGVYRWTKGKNEGAEAFRDGGKAIYSQTTNNWAIAAELELAQQKVQAGEWKEIRAFGAEEYRRAAWIQGRAMGIKVEGYKPSKEELAQYGQAPSQGLRAIKRRLIRPTKAAFNKTPNSIVNLIKTSHKTIQKTAHLAQTTAPQAVGQGCKHEFKNQASKYHC